MQGQDKLHINSIYRAPEGEGIFVGTPQVFVRFQGCSIGCHNCDSVDTWDFEGSEDMSVEAVVRTVRDRGGEKFKRVSITGGDPLHPKLAGGVSSLARELKARGYFVHLEAAGTRVVHDIFDVIEALYR